MKLKTRLTFPLLGWFVYGCIRFTIGVDNVGSGYNVHDDEDVRVGSWRWWWWRSVFYQLCRYKGYQIVFPTNINEFYSLSSGQKNKK